MVGKTLAHYEILEPLGAGGMGEVYRARDTKLARDVAVKVLPPHLADDRERLARMQREAQLLAALNHPNIAAIYGLEDADGVRFLAMELAEGQTLAQRLSDGALSVDEALKIALQIAEALESAHEAGIVHRDLKPANVQVAVEGAAAGQVKVLDFGLAKAYEPDGTTSAMSPDLSASPTMAAAATATGMIMGTAAYMSPEQARGKALDKRTDIWAFGCVVFEMLTGKKAFEGETVTDILAAIVHQEPQWEALPPDTPLRIRELLARCLEKQPDERLRDVGECRIAVREYLADPEGERRRALAGAGGTADHGISWTQALPLAFAALLIGSLAAWWTTRPEPPRPEQPMRFEIELPEQVNFSSTGRRVLAISPDGSRIVFVADGRLWMRLIDDLVPAPISGTDAARSPFFSPDGQQVGFEVSSTNELKRVAVSGGAPVLIGTIGPIYGASWADNGMIYVGQGGGGIWQVPGAGGTPEVVIEVQDDQQAHGPQLLPGGEWLLFTLRRGTGGWNGASIVAQSLVTQDRVVLIEGGTEGRWVPTGHLVYVLDGTLLAVAFDPETMEPPSGPVSIIEGIRTTTFTGAAQYGFSQSGGLVYVPGSGATNVWQLAWVDRGGQIEALPFEPRDSGALDLSPDEQRIAVTIAGDDGDRDIWIYEVGRPGSGVLLTTEGSNEGPVWSPDGEWVFFRSDRGGSSDIWRRPADRSRDAELVLDMEAELRPNAISANGELLLFTSGPGSAHDVGIMALDADAAPEMIVAGPADEIGNSFSPDGRFFAFGSNETGQYELYVREMASNRTFPVSTSTRGGGGAVWSQDGREIFYGSTNSSGILVAEVTLEPFSASDPVEITDIQRRFLSNFDVTADGQRLLLTTHPFGTDVSGAAPATPRINVIVNWFEELKERVPTGR